MPISKISYGKFEDVTLLSFGTGDILFTSGKWEEESKPTMLIFSESHPKPIGEVTEEYKGKSSDELPPVKCVFEFSNPQAITALIHSLVELQKELF